MQCSRDRLTRVIIGRSNEKISIVSFFCKETVGLRGYKMKPKDYTSLCSSFLYFSLFWYLSTSRFPVPFVVADLETLRFDSFVAEMFVKKLVEKATIKKVILFSFRFFLSFESDLLYAFFSFSKLWKYYYIII